MAFRAVGYPVVPMPVPVGLARGCPPRPSCPKFRRSATAITPSTRSSAWLGIGSGTLNGN